MAAEDEEDTTDDLLVQLKEVDFGQAENREYNKYQHGALKGRIGMSIIKEV
jgi:hypothetical protein